MAFSRTAAGHAATMDFMARQNQSKLHAHVAGVADAKNRSTTAAHLKSVRKSAKGGGFDAGSSKSYLSGYKSGMKARGRGIKHRPSGTPRGGQFY